MSCKVTDARSKNRQKIKDESNKNKEERKMAESQNSVRKSSKMKRIQYQVMQGMHNKAPAKAKKEDSKSDKPGMTPFQEALHERLMAAQV